MNRYRVVKAPDGWPESLPFRVGWEGHPDDYGVGEEFDRDFTVEQEQDNLKSGLLEIVPADYEVVGPNEVYGHKKGDRFKAALLIEQEAHLVQSGQVQRVKPKKQQEK